MNYQKIKDYRNTHNPYSQRLGIFVEEIGPGLARAGIAVRAGLHCAPLAHRTAGTLETGTVRLSFSHWNTAGEVQRFLEAMGEILA